MKVAPTGLVAMLVASLALGSCSGSPSTPSPAVTATPTDVETPAPTPSAPATPEPIENASPTPTVSPGPLPTPGPTSTPVAFVAYIVRPGDTLGSISGAFATTWQSLVYWNQDAYPTLDPDASSYNPNYLAVGWRLRLQPGVVVPFDAPLPPAPTIAPTPRPTAKPPPPSATGQLVTNGSRTTARVALTLDMGGRVGDALAIMTWLRDHDVGATIFMTGEMADSTATDAGRLVLARVDARPDLFDLGNHSYSHPHMTTLSATAMAAEIRSAEAAIGRYASTSPRPFFRPPYGEWNQALVDTAASVGYRFSVMWDVDTIDWRPIADGGPTAQQIVAKVVGRAEGGSIILMHLGGYETLDALPGIVNGLRARGLELVTLGQLFGT